VVAADTAAASAAPRAAASAAGDAYIQCRRCVLL
jgi:hypothetical protein